MIASTIAVPRGYPGGAPPGRGWGVVTIDEMYGHVTMTLRWTVVVVVVVVVV